jgi:hypothetical protein
MHHLYVLELHRERLASYERDIARRYSRPSTPKPATTERFGAGFLRRRQPRVVVPDAC